MLMLCSLLFVHTQALPPSGQNITQCSFKILFWSLARIIHATSVVLFQPYGSILQPKTSPAWQLQTIIKNRISNELAVSKQCKCTSVNSVHWIFFHLNTGFSPSLVCSAHAIRCHEKSFLLNLTSGALTSNIWTQF